MLATTSKEEGNTSVIESLPDELLSHILVRVPSDDLYDIARVVCRRWYHIIHSDAFVNTHLHHSTYGLLLSNGSEHRHSVFVTKMQGRTEISELSCKCRTSAWASCNGLFLDSRSYEYTPYILNPATKQAFVPPPFDSGFPCIDSCGIAYAAASMEYKLVQPHAIKGRSRAYQYHLTILTVGVDDSWRHVGVEHLSKNAMTFFGCVPLITEGFMHWAEDSEEVLTLNVETEIITETNAPRLQSYGRKRCIYYLSTGRYLSLLIWRGDYLWEVWEMKSETGEWRKLQTNIKFDAQMYPQFQLCACEHEIPDSLWPLGWVKYPEVLAFATCNCNVHARTCILYHLPTHEVDSTELPTYCSRYYTFPHKNTLLWLSSAI